LKITSQPTAARDGHRFLAVGLKSLLPMSRWEHSICLECYENLQPKNASNRLLDVPRETCCFCGRETSDGIHVRQDGESLPCKGNCFIQPFPGV